MKRFVIFTLVFGIVVSFASAQDGQQQITEVSVERFELEGSWFARMSSDQGYVTTQRLRGGPNGKTPIAGEEGMQIPDEFVLGVRVDFLRRGHSSVTISPARPISVEGIVDEISVWVVGRNHNHRLVLLLQDHSGRNYEISMGNLNFQGWQRMSAMIPPQSIDGVNGVIQRKFYGNGSTGLKITGFRIVFDPLEAYDSFYVYFDDLRANTDLYHENNFDEDDMIDMW